jgi:TetR/AcrR family transcriptional regulator
VAERATTPRRAPRSGERKRDPERTKQAILDAAVEEFATKGYAGARTADIAAAAGVNQQLIAYYFDGKAGLAKAMGRQWRAAEAAMPGNQGSLADSVRTHIKALARSHAMFNGAKLVAWNGLADATAEIDEEEERESTARLREEVAQIAAEQRAGGIDPDLDPAALLLITMSAASAPAVYPQLVRALYGTSAESPEFLEHYAEQLAKVVERLARDH